MRKLSLNRKSRHYGAVILGALALRKLVLFRRLGVGGKGIGKILYPKLNKGGEREKRKKCSL